MEPEYTFSSLPIFLNPRQERIFKRLNRLVGMGPALFYKDACRLMSQKSDLQSTSHLVSHLLRDIESAVRDVLEPFIDRASIGEKDPEETHRVEITSILSALGIPVNDPLAKAWFGVIGRKNIKALHARAHRNNLEPPRPVDSEFYDFWFDMEVIFDVILDRYESNFIKTLGILDKLRKKKIPSKKDIEFIKTHIPHNIVAFNYFFQGLNYPEWLRPLSNGGIFSNPPEPIEDRSTGSVSYQAWPQSHYLLKMAPIEPALVSDIIEGIETKNGYVQADIVDAVCILPPYLAAKHAEKISQWIKTPTFIVENKIGTLVSYLAEAKETNAAVGLSEEFLRFRPGRFNDKLGTEEKLSIPVEPLPRVNSWEYSEFLKNNFPDLINAAPREALTLVINLLEEALLLSEYSKADVFLDSSDLWRPAIEEHEQNQERGEPKNELVTAVRDSAIQYINQFPENFEKVVLELEEKRWTVFRRIALFLTRLFGSQNFRLVEIRILDQELFYYLPVHYEYVHLLQDYFSKLNAEDQETLLSWIKQGPKFSGEKDLSPELRDHWQLRRLSVLKGQLSSSWESYRKKLLKKYTEPEYPDLLAWSSGVMVGPTSPISVEQLRKMEIIEVINYLQNWKAPKGFTMDSPEGISRALTEVISEVPSNFAIDAEKFKICDPTYIHGLFSGLHEAVKKGKEFDWHPVIKLMNWVVKQGKEIPGRQVDDSWDIDPDWGWTRTEISRLLESGFTTAKNQIPYGLNRSVWKVILPLTDDSNPTPSEDDGSSMDPATYSLNTTRGTAFHALISYALWKKRNIAERTGKNIEDIEFKGNMPEVLNLLEKHLDPDYDPAPSIRAVYGTYFSNLAYLDHNWVLDNKDRIFPKEEDSRKFWNASWSSFLGFNQPKLALIRDLYMEYLFSTQLLEKNPMKEGWGNNPNEKLVEHLIAYYAWNKLDLDSEIMQAFWSTAPRELRGHAISFIGRKGKGASKEIISRFTDLWESRLTIATNAADKSPHIDELKAFGWWFVSGDYDDEWCFSQLEKVLQITGEVEYDHGVVERLASISDKFPLHALNILENMIEGEKRGWGIGLWLDSIRTILQNALSSKDLKANSVAIPLINRLAARGYSEFGNLLKS